MLQTLSDNETDFWRLTFLGNRLFRCQDALYQGSYRYVKLGCGPDVRCNQKSYPEPQYVAHYQHEYYWEISLTLGYSCCIGI